MPSHVAGDGARVCVESATWCQANDKSNRFTGESLLLRDSAWSLDPGTGDYS
jgi:hypothetical protein